MCGRRMFRAISFAMLLCLTVSTKAAEIGIIQQDFGHCDHYCLRWSGGGRRSRICSSCTAVSECGRETGQSGWPDACWHRAWEGNTSKGLLYHGRSSRALCVGLWVCLARRCSPRNGNRLQDWLSCCIRTRKRAKQRKWARKRASGGLPKPTRPFTSRHCLHFYSAARRDDVVNA